MHKKGVKILANRKIGAFIALDGEKQFRQDVTSCNKTLSSLKSEMSLVKAESEGQANSLDSLRKKHEVLNKTLDAHKEKEEAIRRALSHAQEEYSKVSSGIATLKKEQESHQKRVSELKEEYQSASDKLEAMTQAGNSSEEEMKKQEISVNALSEALEKEGTELNDVSSALSKGEKNLQTASNRIKDWETKLNTAQAQTIKATKALNENAAYMNEAEKATDHCAESIDEFGKRIEKSQDVTIGFSTILKTNLCNSLIDVAKDGAQQAGKSILDMENSQSQLRASTGLTAAEMKKYKESMDALYQNNYGENLDDIAQSMALVKQYTNEIDPHIIEEMTENGIAMRDVFDMDLSETIRGVDAMMENMGTDAQTAFDLMAKGAQKGLNKSGELADNIAEYGPLWAQAGFSAQEMFAIMENGLDSGAYNLDKVNDFVKEFGNSLADGRIEQNLNSFSEETKTLFYQWQAGKATTKDVFYSIINDLNSATNKQEMLTLASNTWSALGEDNALKVITSLNKTNDTYKNVKGTMEEIKNIKYDTLESRIQQLGRKVVTGLAKPLAEDTLPIIEDGLDMVLDNTDKLISLTKVAVSGLMAYKTVAAAITAYKTAAELATVQQGLLNAVMSVNPAMLIATGIMAVGTALVFLSDNTKTVSEETMTLISESEELADGVASLSEEMQRSKTDWQETTASIEAQKAAAGNLVDELYALENQSNKTEGEKQRMRIVIGELNQMFPELSLAIDEETGKLNQNRESVERSIKASLEYSKAKAAEEKLAEISKELADAELEKYEVEKKNQEIAERLNEVQTKRNELAEKGAKTIDEYGQTVNSTYYEDMQLMEEETKLKEQWQENQKTIEDLQENYEDLNGTYGTVEEYMQTQIEKSKEVSEAYQGTQEAAEATAAAQQEAAEATALKIAETYTGMQETLSEVLNNQMNMFEKFDEGTKLSTSELLNNMQSQLDGVANWADNMALLADRGINQNLLAYLAELGPEGAGYVATFASMSDEELKKANDMWQESLDMKEGAHESVQGMLESYTTALNGGKDAVSEAIKEVGNGTMQGLLDSMDARMDEVGEKGKEAGTVVTDSVAEGAETHSPSRKTLETGKNVIEGLVLGMATAAPMAEKTAAEIGKSITSKIDLDLQQSKFVKAGNTVTSGLTNGIRSGQSTVLRAVSSVTGLITTNVNAKTDAALFVRAGMNIPNGLAAGINSAAGSAVSAASALARSVSASASDVGSLRTVGYNLAAGMAEGILAGRSRVIEATANVCAAAVQKAKSDLQINSPSKVFKRIGTNMAEGQALGYKEGTENLNRMIEDSVKLPTGKQTTIEARNIDTGNGNLTYRGLAEAFRIATESAMTSVLKKANINISLGREFDRNLRNRGVTYT